MADRLIFEVVAEGKGLKVVQRQADSLARSVERTNTAREKAGKGQNSYNKREKAIHQSNLSSAKGFSKMNQTMGSGSSGLVGAYATLAANVFAATAAFNALRRAAQLEQLIAGLEQVGAAAGRKKYPPPSHRQIIKIIWFCQFPPAPKVGFCFLDVLLPPTLLSTVKRIRIYNNDIIPHNVC